MIDFENVKEEFRKYVSKYNLDDFNIKRKVEHSYRVSELCEKIAKSLKLSGEKLEIAKLIGLLHDIGRFEQREKYGTFIDAFSIDHGQLGVEILEKSEYLRNYIKTTEYDNMIKTAIFNHNKYGIEKGLDAETLMYCKIVRDSDKLDIFYEAVEIFWEDREKVKETITPKVWMDFINGKQILNQDKITKLDKVVAIISFIYDIYYKESFSIIKERDYINRIVNKFEIEDKSVQMQFEEIYNIAKRYINNR